MQCEPVLVMCGIKAGSHAGPHSSCRCVYDALRSREWLRT